MQAQIQGKDECFPTSVCMAFDRDWTHEVRPEIEHQIGTVWANTVGPASRVNAARRLLNLIGAPQIMASGSWFYGVRPKGWGRGRIARFKAPMGRGILIFENLSHECGHAVAFEDGVIYDPGTGTRFDDPNREALDIYPRWGMKPVGLCGIVGWRHVLTVWTDGRAEATLNCYDAPTAHRGSLGRAIIRGTRVRGR